jgi:cytochrome c553
MLRLLGIALAAAANRAVRVSVAAMLGSAPACREQSVSQSCMACHVSLWSTDRLGEVITLSNLAILMQAVYAYQRLYRYRSYEIM